MLWRIAIVVAVILLAWVLWDATDPFGAAEDATPADGVRRLTAGVVEEQRVLRVLDERCEGREVLGDERSPLR